MKLDRSRGWIVLCAALLAMVAAFGMSGCGSDNSTATLAGVRVHTGRVAYIGDLRGTLGDELVLTFSNRVPYDGTSSNLPILISAQSVQSLSPTQRQGILATFANFKPIVLVQGGEAEINALLGILGLDQNYTLPEGLPEGKHYVELFAVDQEADGHVFSWSMYPPNESLIPSDDPAAPQSVPDTDSAFDQVRRANIFHDWFDVDDNRVTGELKSLRQQATRALAEGVAAESAELTQIAKGFVVTKNFSCRGNNYQLSYYIYSCHSFNAADGTDYDWFYVRQEGMLNASGAYGGVTSWYGGGPSDEVHYYIGNYKMNNLLEGLTGQGSAVALMASNPQNANNVAQVTSGVSWNFGGSVGFQGTQATGSLNAGVTISNSTTVNVSDCEVVNNSADNVNNARWRYEFKKASQTVYFAYTGLSEPPVLSRANFQPVNQWIWKFAPSVRDSNRTSFDSQFDVDLIWSVGGQSYGWWIADKEKHYTYGGGSWQFQVPLSYPPLLVAPHNLDFSAAGQFKSLDLAVSRNWTASSNQAWCRVEPASGTGTNPHVNVTVDPNTGGSSRTAVITFSTEDGKGSDTTTVFQSQY